MVPSHRRVGCAEALLSFRYIDGPCLRISFSRRRWAVVKDKVMAGGTPANLAALIAGVFDPLMRGNPDGSLSSRVGCAEALLSFRYIDGPCLRISFSRRRWAVVKDKVMAGGTPANLAALVRLRG